MALTCVGNVLAITLPTSQVGARYFSMFLVRLLAPPRPPCAPQPRGLTPPLSVARPQMCLGSYCAYNLSFAWISSTVPRPRAKRSGALFLVNAMGNASHFCEQRRPCPGLSSIAR